MGNKSDTKKIVSVRIGHSDLEKIKIISQRLRVRESKIIRFTIKAMLSRLGPLHDPKANGKDLMPIFADLGNEIAGYFDFDYDRLESVINGGLSNGDDRRVDSDDVALVAMNDMPPAYLYMKLRELSPKSVDRNALSECLRDYLYEKYVSREL